MREYVQTSIKPQDKKKVVFTDVSSFFNFFLICQEPNQNFNFPLFLFFVVFFFLRDKDVLATKSCLKWLHEVSRTKSKKEEITIFDINRLYEKLCPETMNMAVNETLELSLLTAHKNSGIFFSGNSMNFRNYLLLLI